MATRQQNTLITLRVLSGKLLTTPDTAFLLHNIYSDTEDGTLTSVPDVQSYTNTNNFYGSDLPAPWESQTSLRTRMYWSIFHTLLPNGYDCVLVHAGGFIYKYEGAMNAWYKITNNNILHDDSGKYNTQWVATPTGVVIIPPSGRAFFYDGEKSGYLGYNFVPKPPEGLGPKSTRAGDKLYPGAKYPSPTEMPEENTYGKSGSPPITNPTMNDSGYAHDGMYNFSTGVPPDFGVGRLGTVITPPGIWSAQGKLLKGSYQAAVQYVDMWGNMSPLSARSSAITFDEQFSWYGTLKEIVGGVIVADVGIPATADRVKKQVIWTNVPIGPENTIGRIIYRTKDTYNSGDLNLYELPGNASGGADSFATVPDNMSVMFPDNIPDAWLINTPMNIIPVPEFRFGVIAFGRLWIGNTIENKGLIRPSVEGLWGTFRANEEIIPDPRGFEITGMKSIEGQLLVFTSKSVFLIRPNQQGDGYITVTLSNNIGCVAPDSLVIMPNNELIWLSDNGFYSWNGKSVIKVSTEIDYFTRRINTGRVAKTVATYSTEYSSYICYVPFEDSVYNNLAFVFDGKTWSSQSQMDIVTGICETQDHRKYVLACGYADKNVNASNVYILNSAKGTSKNVVIETGWINLSNPQTNNIQTVYVLVRDTLYQEDALPYIASDNTVPDYIISMQYYINMDMQQKGKSKFRVTSPQDNQYYFNRTLNNTSIGFQIYTPEPIYKRARLFWLKLDIIAEQADCFKFRFTTSNYFKFMGIAFNTLPTGDGLTGIPVLQTFAGSE